MKLKSWKHAIEVGCNPKYRNPEVWRLGNPNDYFSITWDGDCTHGKDVAWLEVAIGWDDTNNPHIGEAVTLAYFSTYAEAKSYVTKLRKAVETIQTLLPFRSAWSIIDTTE